MTEITLVPEIIRRKRDGSSLSKGDIERLVDGLATGALPAEQAAAFAMAVFFRSLSRAESGILTRAMAESGTVLNWDHLDGPVVDKHSTGGVGDKVSLMLAPILAACGAYVPMIAGRSLGHTGGTIDKLESIPGYDVSLPFDRFAGVVQSVGCSIIGQTSELAPADRRLYAIRDVTATVESIPLITASILAKKIAAGLQSLVMDVKVGNGAFASTNKMAQELAESIVATAESAGLPVTAVLTDMNECLGSTAGNALEVAEAINYLRGASPDERLLTVTEELCAQALLLSGVSSEKQSAIERVRTSISSGSAAEIFGRMVALHGGPADLVENPVKYLQKAAVTQPAIPDEAGYLSAVDTRRLGNIVIELGGGRASLNDAIDVSVGLSDIANVGDYIDADKPFCLVHASSLSDANTAATACLSAITTSSEPILKEPIVLDVHAHCGILV